MSFDACAELVRKADPDKFLSVTAARPDCRDRLFALYAFNVEVSRAPWVTKEPMIAEMRLQWWRDVVEEIASGGPVRNHEVATPLAGIVREYDLDTARLDNLIDARRHDIYREPFADAVALWNYIDRTSGHLMILAAQSLGPLGADIEGLTMFQKAAGAARYLRAIPQLRVNGYDPLPADLDERGLATQGLEFLARAKATGIARHHLPAAWSGWWAETYLRRTLAGKTSEISPFRQHAALLYRQFFNRF